MEERYHWRELPQVSFFVATSILLLRQTRLLRVEGRWGGEKTGGGGSILRLVGVHTMSGGDGEVGTDEDGATYVTEAGRGKAGGMKKGGREGDGGKGGWREGDRVKRGDGRRVEGRGVEGRRMEVAVSYGLLASTQ